MQGLFKYFHWTSFDEETADCEKGLKNLKRIRATFPPIEDEKSSLLINLKA